jgi:hypothetical protein
MTVEFEPPGNWPSEPNRQPCTWVYIPLPQCLPLPEGFHMVQEAMPEEMYVQVAITHLRYLLRIWHQPRSANPLLSGLYDVSAVVHRSLGVEPPEPGSVVPEELASVLTIVEVGVPASPQAPPGDIDAAVDIAIEAARNLQSVVSTVSRALRLVSRASLPPFVQFMTGALVSTDESFREEREDDILLQDVDRGTGVSYFGLAPEPLADEALEILAVAADVLGRGSPLAGYADLRRELAVQLHHDGNDRVAVVMAATAAEVLLDTVLLHLLWQEHTDPADAVRVFDRSIRHKTRVSAYLPHRLGGDWDPNGEGAVGRYFARVTDLRNRVVHTGLIPTRDEALVAEAAVGELESFLADRLAADENRNRYPRTALALMGRPGMERRNAFTRRIQELGDDVREPDWIEAFKRYRHVVDLRSRSDLPEPGSDPARLELYVELPERRYLMYDRVVLKVAVLADGETFLTDEQRLVLDQLATEVPPDAFHRIRLFGSQLTAPPDLDWRPEDEFFPELAMWPGTRTEPPPPPTT